MENYSPKTIATALAGAVLIIYLFAGITQISEGYRGVKKVWGKVQDESYTPGIYFVEPISNTLVKMSVREEKLEITTNAYTKDTQTVAVRVAITYFPDSATIHKIYSQFGDDWERKIIEPAILGSLKDSIGQYVADDLISQREKVKINAQDELKAALSTRSVTVTRLDILDLDFQDAYEQSVEAKVVAIQEAERSKNKTVQIQEESEQKIISAKAEAESMRIRSNALSQNKSLVEYEAVQKWNGVLPTYMMGNSVPFINLGK